MSEQWRCVNVFLLLVSHDDWYVLAVVLRIQFTSTLQPSAFPHLLPHASLSHIAQPHPRAALPEVEVDQNRHHPADHRSLHLCEWDVYMYRCFKSNNHAIKSLQTFAQPVEIHYHFNLVLVTCLLYLVLGSPAHSEMPLVQSPALHSYEKCY